jgi:hypothetical protein
MKSKANPRAKGAQKLEIFTHPFEFTKTNIRQTFCLAFVRMFNLKKYILQIYAKFLNWS